MDPLQFVYRAGRGVDDNMSNNFNIYSCTKYVNWSNFNDIFSIYVYFQKCSKPWFFPPIKLTNWKIYQNELNQSEVNLSVQESKASHLDGHDLARGFEDHLVDRAIRPATDLPEVSQILCSEVTVLLWRDLQLPRRLDTVSLQTLSGGRDKIGWGNMWDRGSGHRRGKDKRERTVWSHDRNMHYRLMWTWWILFSNSLIWNIYLVHISATSWAVTIVNLVSKPLVREQMITSFCVVIQKDNCPYMKELASRSVSALVS